MKVLILTNLLAIITSTFAKSDKYSLLDRIVDLENQGDPFSDVSFVIHRNGESESCGTSDPKLSNIIDVLHKVLDQYDFDDFMMYELDYLLTIALSLSLLSPNDCTPENNNTTDISGLVEFCFKGYENTPILPDHSKNIPFKKINGEESLPCHFHTREGLRFTSLQQLVDYARADHHAISPTCTNKDGRKVKELHFYAVPAGRLFFFAPSFIGEIFELEHVHHPKNLSISLEVLSIFPHVFEIKNGFTVEESEEIKKGVLEETRDSHRLKRSSTGATGYSVSSSRTSENGFDTGSPTAFLVKRRAFKILGFHQYYESFADGLQVLRYNQTSAYVAHYDYLDDPKIQSDRHDYNSSAVGTNRFATIFMYHSTLPSDGGGETVFPRAWPVGQSESDGVDESHALDQLRLSNTGKLLKRNSWQEKMVVSCRSRLAIQPKLARAILFYSQLPNGELDPSSLHGGCPVLNGTKWGTNLWVWNGPRNGYSGQPLKGNQLQKQHEPTQQKAIFRNSGVNQIFERAQLYYQDTFWGNLGFNDPPLSVNTSEGHKWYVKVNGEIKRKWVIDKSQFKEFLL